MDGTEDAGDRRNVVRLPREWVGPPGELVPVTPRGRAERERLLREQAAAAGSGETGTTPDPFTASAPEAGGFWTAEASAVHRAIPDPFVSPAASGTSPPPRRLRLARVRSARPRRPGLRARPRVRVRLTGPPPRAALVVALLFAMVAGALTLGLGHGARGHRPQPAAFAPADQRPAEGLVRSSETPATSTPAHRTTTPRRRARRPSHRRARHPSAHRRHSSPAPTQLVTRTVSSPTLTTPVTDPVSSAPQTDPTATVQATAASAGGDGSAASGGSHVSSGNSGGGTSSAAAPAGPTGAGSATDCDPKCS